MNVCEEIVKHVCTKSVLRYIHIFLILKAGSRRCFMHGLNFLAAAVAPDFHWL